MLVKSDYKYGCFDTGESNKNDMFTLLDACAGECVNLVYMFIMHKNQFAYFLLCTQFVVISYTQWYEIRNYAHHTTAPQVLSMHSVSLCLYGLKQELFSNEQPYSVCICNLGFWEIISQCEKLLQLPDFQSCPVL